MVTDVRRGRQNSVEQRFRAADRLRELMVSDDGGDARGVSAGACPLFTR